MTDRELLELAAKAAGFDAVWDEQLQEYAVYDSECLLIDGWSPLTDDGDALRLAVKLSLEIERSPYKDGIVYVGKVGELKWMEDADETQDILEATRRAIVRAAAEIGKGM